MVMMRSAQPFLLARLGGRALPTPPLSIPTYIDVGRKERLPRTRRVEPTRLYVSQIHGKSEHWIVPKHRLFDFRRFAQLSMVTDGRKYHQSREHVRGGGKAAAPSVRSV